MLLRSGHDCRRGPTARDVIVALRHSQHINNFFGLQEHRQRRYRGKRSLTIFYLRINRFHEYTTVAPFVPAHLYNAPP